MINYVEHENREDILVIRLEMFKGNWIKQASRGHFILGRHVSLYCHARKVHLRH